MREIAAKIKSAREQAGLSQADVAARLGLSPQGYGYFESGARTIGLHYFVQLPGIFGIPVTSLLPECVIGRLENNIADPGLALVHASWGRLPQFVRETILILVRNWKQSSNAD